MRLHRRRQALGRHGEKRLVELAHQHGRPFGEAGVLGGERIVLDQRQVRVLGERMRAFVDARRTRRGIEHDLVLLQLLLVVGKARHLERLVAEEAMAARFLAGLDAGDLERHHLAVEQQHDRMQRADPAQLGAVVELGVEAHRLRPGEIHDRLAQHLVDDLARGAARLVDAGDVEVALLLVLDDLRLVDRLEAGTLEKAGKRLLGRADARALALFRHGRRLLRHVLDDQRQPARRRKAARLAHLETLRLQAVDHQPAQVVGGARLQARGDLFGKQLEQQLRHGASQASEGGEHIRDRANPSDAACGTSPPRQAMRSDRGAGIQGVASPSSVSVDAPLPGSRIASHTGCRDHGMTAV